MKNLEEFLEEGKKITIKRKYTENHPASTVGKTASVRNEVLKAVKDGVITEEEFSKIISKVSASPNRWRNTNSKYFNVSEDGIKLSKWGLRILSELDLPTLRAFPICEATVVMDAMDPKSKILKKLLKKHKVTMEIIDPSGPSGWPEVELTGSREDLTKVLASEDGWDDADLAEYIEEAKAEKLEEKIKVTKSDWPSAVVKYKGKKYEIEFDEYDTIDDHGNEGKDLYFMGVDQEGGNWEVDVYADYRDEVQDVHWDTLIYKGIDESVTEKLARGLKPLLTLGSTLKKNAGEDVLLDLSDKFDILGDEDADNIASHLNMAIELMQDGYGKSATEKLKQFNKACKDALAGKEVGSAFESVVNEKDDAGTHLDKLAELVGKAKSFMDVGKELKAAKYKYDFGTGMMPHYQVTADGFTFMILNKKYVDKGDREVNGIAIGLLENIKTQTTDMENTFSIHESFDAFNAASGFLNEALGSSLLSSVLSSGKEGKYAKQNLKQLAGGFYQLAKVALDKVGDEDMIVSNNPSKVFKENGGSEHILFFISDNEKDNPYCPYDAGYGSLKTIPGGGTLIAAMSGDREFYTNDWSRYSRDRAFKKDGKKGKDDQVGVSHKYRGWSGTGLNNGKRIAEISDRVVIINLDLIRQKYSTAQLRAARAEAKSGAIAFTNDKDFKKANNDRYHQILATKAATMPLDKMVAGAIDMLTDQIKNGLASGEKTRYEEIKIGQSAKGKEVKLRDASNHMSSVLDDYSRYCDYIRQEEESEKRFGSSESWYKREIKNYALSLKEKIAKIEGFDYAW